MSGMSVVYSRFRRYLRGRADSSDPEVDGLGPMDSSGGRPAGPGVADRRARLDGYTLNDAEVRTFARILEVLEVAMPAPELLARLGTVMTASDVSHLVALLSFVSARSRTGVTTGAAARVRRAADVSLLARTTPRRLSLLFVTGEFPNPVHGGGGRVADFIKGLSRDHDVYLYAGYLEQDAAAYAALRPYCRRIGLSSYREFDGNLAGIRRVIAGVTIDVVHYEWPRALTNYHRAWGAHHVFTFMESFSLRLRRDMDRTAPLGPEWLRLMIRLIRALKIELVDADQVDGLIVASEPDGRFYARFDCGREYHVLNHGVDFDSFCLPPAAPEVHTLTFVGNFRHRPNEDALRWFFGEVFPRIRAQVPDVKLYVVGVDPTDEVRAHHDGRHVVVTGTVDDVRPYIQRASVCVAPLVSGAGLRGKLIQYAALERVCVATSIASAGLVFEDGHDIAVADDPDAFAERVTFLLRNPGVARDMGAAAHHTARTHYTLSQLTRQLYGIHDRLEQGIPTPSSDRRWRAAAEAEAP